MPRVTCQCGARYKVPDSSIGKKSKCKKCGEVFTLTADDDEILAIADEPVVAAEERGPAAVAAFHLDRPPVSVVQTAIKRTYLTDVLWTFLFPSSPANLIAFVILCLSLGIMRPLIALVPFVGFFASIVLVGWYCAFRFEVIRSAAAGDEHLPSVNVAQDIVGDMVAPFFQWLGSWIIVFLPAVLFLFHSLSKGTLTPGEVWNALSGGVSGFLQVASGRVQLLMMLVLLGMATWPILALCVAMGGFSTLRRPDLIAATVFKTLPSYVLMLVLMFAATAAEKAMTDAAGTGLSGGAGGGSTTQAVGAGVLLYALTTSAGVYLDIVLMRLIGLHYHHFKSRFAWEWE